MPNVRNIELVKWSLLSHLVAYIHSSILLVNGIVVLRWVCRDRMEHLLVLLSHLHPMLQRQQLDYHVYVVEQVSGFFYFYLVYPNLSRRATCPAKGKLVIN